MPKDSKLASTHAKLLNKTDMLADYKQYNPADTVEIKNALSKQLLKEMKKVVYLTPDQIINIKDIMELIHGGANPNTKYKGMTLIHVVATQVNHFNEYHEEHKQVCMDAVEKLVSTYKLDINERCDKGTALQIMLDLRYIPRHYDFIKKMLSLGADPNTTNKNSKHIHDIIKDIKDINAQSWFDNYRESHRTHSFIQDINLDTPFAKYAALIEEKSKHRGHPFGSQRKLFGSR